MDETYPSGVLTDWLILIRTPSLSPSLCKKLLLQVGLPGAIISADKTLLHSAGLTENSIASIRHPDWKAIEEDVRWCDKPGNHFVAYTDKEYPGLLKYIDDPPLGLFVRGNIDALNSLQIAVVGSRMPTPGGKRIAYNFARSLSLAGLTVTSGLATGIDGAAHEGALSSDRLTIAVLGNGVDVVYPRKNRHLSDKICDHGAIVSEFPTKTPPLPQNFPKRNRVISGLSVGTLVVEAALKSGSLITARLAMEQGREVFAVPGSIHNPTVRGCHALISQGAKLTTCIEDILEEIDPLCLAAKQSSNAEVDGDQLKETLDEKSKVLLDNIGYESVTVDQLVEETGLKAKEISVLLLNMELLNLVESLPGGRFTRK